MLVVFKLATRDGFIAQGTRGLTIGKELARFERIIARLFGHFLLARPATASSKGKEQRDNQLSFSFLVSDLCK